MRAIKWLRALAVVCVLLPALAIADPLPLGPGASMVCRSTVPTVTGSRSVMWCKSTDSNKLHFLPFGGSDVALGGGVSSVALTAPGFLSVSGSPITSSGTFALSLATETANTGFWGPTTGSAAAPTFRTMVNADLATTNAVLQMDWFVSPVDEMANGLHSGVYASFAGHTCGVRFMTKKALTVTGVRFYWPGTISKTMKVSLWNKAGTRLANASASQTTSASVQTISFGSSVALTANLLYYVSGYVTDGSTGLGYGVSNTDLNLLNSQVDVHYPGSAVIVWTGWGADSSGDVFPNGDNTNVICQFDPVYTVP